MGRGGGGGGNMGDLLWLQDRVVRYLRCRHSEVTLSTACGPTRRCSRGPSRAARPHHTHHPTAFLSPLCSTGPAGAMGAPSPVPETPPRYAHPRRHQSTSAELCSLAALRQCVAGRVLAPQLKKPSLC